MHREQLSLRLSAARVMRRLLSRALLGAWGSWREVCQEAAEERAKMRRCMARLMLKSLYDALELWRANTKAPQQPPSGSPAPSTMLSASCDGRATAAMVRRW